MRATNIDETIAKRLRARRLLLGYSQEYIASRLGVSPQQVSKYEAVKAHVSATHLARLADVLKVSVNYFFGTKKDQPYMDDEIVDILSEPRVVAVLKSFIKLPAQIQSSMVHLMDSVDTHLSSEATSERKAFAMAGHVLEQLGAELETPSEQTPLRSDSQIIQAHQLFSELNAAHRHSMLALMANLNSEDAENNEPEGAVIPFKK